MKLNRRERQNLRALPTIIPLMWTYLTRMKEARCIQRYASADEREKAGGPPPPGWSLMDCNGRCEACEYRLDCKGEWWWNEMEKLERQYNVLTVAAVFARLQIAAPQLAHAVWAEYGGDDDKTLIVEWRNPHHYRWARAGLLWMARKIPFKLTACNAQPLTTREKVIEEMEDGEQDSFVIACRVGCTPRRVNQIKQELREEGIVR